MRYRRTAMQRAVALLCAIVVFMTSAIFLRVDAVRADDVTKIHFLCITNNNKGSDAIVVESGGRFLMVDTGAWQDRERIRECLDGIGVTKDNLEAVICTHAHGDHCGYLNDMMSVYPPKRIYLMPFAQDCYTGRWTDTSWANAMRTADKKGIPVIDTFEEGASETPWKGAGRRMKRSYTSAAECVTPAKNGEDYVLRYTSSPHFTFGSARIDVYNYSQEYIKAGVSNANDTSLVVKITDGGHTALITGDLSNAKGGGSDEGYDERKIAEEIGHVDILKLPHHGYGWYETNTVEDLASFSAKWLIQTGSTDLMFTPNNDRETSLPDTVSEVMRQTANGARYAATTWFNADRIGHDNPYALDAITIDMGTLDSNLPDCGVICVDRAGNTYKFLKGESTVFDACNTNTILANGHPNDKGIVTTENGEQYFVSDESAIWSGSFEWNGKTYTANPNNGTVTEGGKSSGLEFASYDTHGSKAGDSTLNVVYDNYRASAFYEEINSIRDSYGKERLKNATSMPTMGRVLEIAADASVSYVPTIDPSEVYIAQMGGIDPARAARRIEQDVVFSKALLSDADSVSVNCVSVDTPYGVMDVYYAMFYAVEEKTEIEDGEKNGDDSAAVADIDSGIVVNIDEQGTGDLHAPRADDIISEDAHYTNEEYFRIIIGILEEILKAVKEK